MKVEEEYPELFHLFTNNTDDAVLKQACEMMLCLGAENLPEKILDCWDIQYLRKTAYRLGDVFFVYGEGSAIILYPEDRAAYCMVFRGKKSIRPRSPYYLLGYIDHKFRQFGLKPEGE